MSKVSKTVQKAPETEGRTIHWARGYDMFVFLLTLGQASTLRKRTAALAQLSLGEAVLDVGCGTGDLTREVHRRVGSTELVAGIDAAPEMIARARYKAQREGMAIDFRLEPIEAMTFADHTFDVVVSSFMFHHLPGSLKQRGLAEIRRVLKPGGRVLIVDFQRMSHGHHLHPALTVGVQDLPVLLTEAGFSQVEWKRGSISLLGLGYVKGVLSAD